MEHIGKVSPVKIIGSRQGNGSGYALSPPFWIITHGDPLPFPEQLMEPVKGLGYRYSAVFQGAPLLIRFPEIGKKFLNCQIPCLGNHHIDSFSIKIFKPFILTQAFNVKLLMKNKIHIPPVGDHLLGHYSLLFSCQLSADS
jgi:hypothetical protein